MSDENYWKTTLTELEHGNQVVLVIIIERTGSAPNIPGAKMFVMQSDVFGTVGGGNSEHNLYERAKNLLQKGKLNIEKIRLDHTEDAVEDSSGMICSGSQTFALITLDEEHIPIVKDIINCVSESISGVLTITDSELDFKINTTIAQDHDYSESGISWKYQEIIGRRDRLFIIGGGHVSLALSRIMKTLSFHITVFDDRANLHTMNSNIYADKKKVITYENIATLIPEGDNIYVAIMTFGHMSDELVLQKIISKRCKYIGMMASSSKKQQVFENLESKGISKKLLDTIYSPIGIKIKSHTPEEIAISIAAQIIEIKNMN